MTLRTLRPAVKKPSAGTAYDRILQGCLWLTVFVLPWFFLPLTADPLELNKTLLFYLLVLVSGITWLLKVLLGHERQFRRTGMELVLGILFFSVLMATIFSAYHYRSIVGTTGYYADSLLAVLFFLLYVYMLHNAVSRAFLPRLMTAFFLSAALVVFFNFLQVFSLFVLPWAFAKNVTFTTVANSTTTFVVYLVLVGLTSFCGLLQARRAMHRIFFTFLGLLSLFLLIVYDQPIGWYLLIAGLVILLVLLNSSVKKVRPAWLLGPSLLIGVGLIALFVNTQALLRANIPGDLALPARSGLAIAWSSFTTPRVLIGSGPETYDAAFSRYRPVSLNTTPLWNLRFQKSSNVWLQWISTVGIVATLALFAVAVITFVRLLRPALRVRPEDGTWWMHIGVALAAAVVFAGTFFAAFNFILAFLFWSLVGVSLIVLRREEETSVTGEARDGAAAFGTSLGFALVIILAIVFVYFAARFWAADRNIALANDAIRRQEKLEDIQGRLASAIGQNSYEQSPYFQLAQNLLVQAQLAANEKTPDGTKIQNLLTASVAATKTGIARYPNYAGSYEAAASLYGSIDALAGVQSQVTQETLTKAAALEPNNAQNFMSLGQYSLTLARQQLAQQTAEEKEKQQVPAAAQESLQKARDAFHTAVEKKPNYLAAALNEALAIRLQGKADEATQYLEKLAASNPLDTDVLFNLAENYRIDGKGEQALTVLQRITSLFPGHSDAHFRLAQFYEERQEREKAVAEYEIVARLNPTNEDIKKKLDELKK